MQPTSFLALLRHHFRLLAENRNACWVLMMFAALAVVGQRIDAPRIPVCYIVYWQDDPWVQRLKAELPTANESIAIEVAPVEQFVNEHGVIEYPRGAHSIQLRPPTPGRDDWVIWYWYSGARAEVLNPVVDWFWSVTRRHVGDPIPMRVRVSSLRPGMAILDVAGPAIRSFVDDGQWKGPVVWVALFFCGCYLPAMALAQQREDRTIYTLVTTPVGWTGVGLSISGFYYALTATVGLSLAIALGYRADASLWATILLASAVYLGVGLTLGCWCGGTASTSAGMLVYLSLAGGVALIAQSVPGLAGAPASVELQVLRILQPAPTSFSVVLSALAGWGLLWLLLARFSFARLQSR